MKLFPSNKKLIIDSASIMNAEHKSPGKRLNKITQFYAFIWLHERFTPPGWDRIKHKTHQIIQSSFSTCCVSWLEFFLQLFSFTINEVCNALNMLTWWIKLKNIYENIIHRWRSPSHHFHSMIRWRQKLSSNCRGNNEQTKNLKLW